MNEPKDITPKYSTRKEFKQNITNKMQQPQQNEELESKSFIYEPCVCAVKEAIPIYSFILMATKT